MILNKKQLKIMKETIKNFGFYKSIGLLLGIIIILVAVFNYKYFVNDLKSQDDLINHSVYFSLDKNKFHFHGKIKALILGIRSTGILF
jgi:predicted negative regulator of RcsB-dependent stress response